MTYNWRKSVEITFPVYRYHPPRGAPGTIVRKQLTMLDGPRTAVGSHDWSQLHNHAGCGISKDATYPFKRDTVPGGILDAKGMHIPILDLDAPQYPPRILAAFFYGFASLLYTYQYRYSFGEPEQLTLDDCKNRLIKLCYQEKRMPRPVKKFKAAKSFYDLISIETGKTMMDVYYKTVEVKNWIDEPKKYS